MPASHSHGPLHPPLGPSGTGASGVGDSVAVGESGAPASGAAESGVVPARPLAELLLGAVASTRATASAEDAADALLLAFSEAIPELAAGVCLVMPGCEQRIVARALRQSGAATADPTRLFPHWAEEEVVSLANGSTLHVAASDVGHLAIHRHAIRMLTSLLESMIDTKMTMDRLAETHDEAESLRHQVIQSEKLASLGQIAAGIVHELNNPLTSILAYSDYLRKKWERSLADPSDIERLRRIGEAADRILAFSRDLITYSRPTASIPGPVSVLEAVERALVFCEHIVSGANVRIERQFEPVRLVSGVMGQLTQVFVNLTTNGCQAMQEGGVLRFRMQMSSDQEHVVVVVEDEGHGIDSAHLERVFEPYFTTKNEGSGTGLGLPIVKRIVESHGGRISAHNLARGAAFTVTLPVSARVSLLDV